MKSSGDAINKSCDGQRLESVENKKKRLSLCGMVINTTIPLLDRTLPQLKTHRSYANQLQQSNWTHDVRRTFPNRFWPRNRSNINGPRDLAHRTRLVWRWTLCQSYGPFTTSHLIRRWTGGSIIHLHQTRQKAKPWILAQSTSKVAKLEPKNGSCRTSDRGKILVLWTSRFTRHTRQQL